MPPLKHGSQAAVRHPRASILLNRHVTTETHGTHNNKRIERFVEFVQATDTLRRGLQLHSHLVGRCKRRHVPVKNRIVPIGVRVSLFTVHVDATLLRGVWRKVCINEDRGIKAAPSSCALHEGETLLGNIGGLREDGLALTGNNTVVQWRATWLIRG